MSSQVSDTSEDGYATNSKGNQFQDLKNLIAEPVFPYI